MTCGCIAAGIIVGLIILGLFIALIVKVVKVVYPWGKKKNLERILNKQNRQKRLEKLLSEVSYKRIVPQTQTIKSTETEIL